MGSQNASEEAGTKKQPVMRTLRVADAALLRALGTHFRSSARVNEVGKLRPKRSDDASRTIDDRQACRGHRPSWPQQGAGIEELTSTTGWLPHTTRAALTGLRKRGYAIERSRSERGDSVYRIVTSATPALAA
jgi:hypothetical protein